MIETALQSKTIPEKYRLCQLFFRFFHLCFFNGNTRVIILINISIAKTCYLCYTLIIYRIVTLGVVFESMNSFNEVFSAVKEYCKEKVVLATYNVFFNDIEAVDFDGNTATLQVRTDRCV